MLLDRNIFIRRQHCYYLAATCNCDATAPGPMAIKYVIAFFGWAIVAAVPFVLALLVSRKRILVGRWIIIRIVAIFDIVGLFGLFDRQVTWSEELGALAEAISPTTELIFLYRPETKFWLSIKNYA